MEISQTYIDFRSKLIGPAYTPSEVISTISNVLPPLAKSLHIGYVAYSFSTPTTPLTPMGFACKKKVFHDEALLPAIPISTEIAESMSTSEEGAFTLFVHPIDNHSFTEEERNTIQLMCWDWFLLCGRSHLMGLFKRAGITDSMTGITNQPGFTAICQAKVANNTLKNYMGVFINLKNFKYVNRTLSSQAGDLALRIFANTVKQHLEEDEVVARLGGDNFFALVKKENIDKFIDKFANLEISLNQGPKSTSIRLLSRMGIYSVKEKDTHSELMNNSSIALLEARSHRAVDILFFSNDMMIRAMHQREISSEFPGALHNKDFVVFYQPKVDLITRKPCGAEALVRWIRHKTIVPPLDFIPVLEREGTICNLDFYVFETTCSDIRQWLDAGITPVRVSTNFSKLHLKDENLAERILGIMEKYNIDSKYIEIELTEVSNFEDTVAMQKFVKAMHQHHILISMDDFGTGYSTLNVLKDMNINIIKLDRSLLDNIGKDDDHDQVILRNIVHMANELHKEVIAEGVETEIQAQFLKEISCNVVQGYLFDKPLVREEFQKRLINDFKYS